MVSHGGPADGVSQSGLVDLEEAGGELFIGAVFIGHVADVEVEV